MNLQKKIAAKVLKCGENAVWLDPKNEKIKTAITRNDIRRFIKEGFIKKVATKKKAPREEKRQQRAGSIKGTIGAREPKKTRWLKVVRPQRRMMKELKKENKLTPHAYRAVYKLIKGNYFRSRAHLMTYLKDKKYIIDDAK
jgi:large subunit ribosomal protein L19e